MPHDRRSFLKGAGIATIAASAAPLSLSLSDGAQIGVTDVAAAAQPRTAAAGRFALELNEQVVGNLFAVRGGNPYADVIEYRSGNDLSTHKSPGSVRYEEISVMVGLEMAPAFWTWVTNMVAGDPAAMDGAIIVADGELNILRRLEFHHAFVTEVQIPALAASNNDAAHMTVKFQPESTHWVEGGGTLIVPMAKQKLWLTSNFRLQVGALPCSRVSSIEALSIKQQLVEFREGGGGGTQLVPGRLEYPNLIATFGAVDGVPWQQWFDDFVIHGNNGDAEELAATLTLLSPDLKSVLASLQLSHVGIVRLAYEEVEPPPTIDIRRLRADMYCEGAILAIGAPD